MEVNPNLHQNSTFLDLAQQQYPELDKYFQSLMDAQKKSFHRNLDLAFTKEGKLSVIQLEVEKIKHLLSHKFFDVMPVLIAKKLVDSDASDLQNISNVDLQELSKREGIPVQSIFKELTEDKLFSPADKKALKTLLEIAAPPMKKRRKKPSSQTTKKYMDAYMRFLLRYHHFTLYYEHLQNVYASIDGISKTFSKINWKGSQRDLAELFIELKEKGYIKEIEIAKIKTCFTESDSIEQLLNLPGEYDDVHKRYQYPKVYFPTSENKFDSIKKNPKDRVK